MSTVAEIERAIEKLPPEQRQEIQHWLEGRAGVSHTREMTPEQVREYMSTRPLPAGPMSPVNGAEVVSWGRGDF